MATTPTDEYNPAMETSDDVVVSDDTTTEPTSGAMEMVMSRGFEFPTVGRSVVAAVGVASAEKFKVTRGFGGVAENAKVNVDKLYLHQVFAGWGVNQSNVIQRQGLGQTAVNNWRIYDGPGAAQAKLVAQTHGMHTLAGKWYHWFNLQFEVERFKGSTLQVMGANDETEDNEWAIVGGTGQFAMARGIINRRVYRYIYPQLTQELTMEFFCRMKEVPPAPTKRGIVGANTGILWEMQGKSQRLENVTIYHVGAVEGFQFSYADEDGKIRTPGTWGKFGPDPLRRTDITFGPSEFVKQIKGAKRGPWLSKFEIVTTHKTYGPFGVDAGTPYFDYPVPEGETVVGFFAKTESTFVNTIGVYTI